MVHHHCDKTKNLINATANPSGWYCTVPFMHTLPVIRGETESRCSVTDGRRIHLRTRTGSSTLGFSVSVKIFARLCVYYAFHIEQALVTFWNGWSWSNIGTYLHREDSSSSLQQLCRIICTRNVLSFSISLSLSLCLPPRHSYRFWALSSSSNMSPLVCMSKSLIQLRKNTLHIN